MPVYHPDAYVKYHNDSLQESFIVCYIYTRPPDYVHPLINTLFHKNLFPVVIELSFVI